MMLFPVSSPRLICGLRTSLIPETYFKENFTVICTIEKIVGRISNFLSIVFGGMADSLDLLVPTFLSLQSSAASR